MEKRILMTRLLMLPLRSLAYPVLALALLVAGCATPLPPNPYASAPAPAPVPAPAAQRPVEPDSVPKPVESVRSPSPTPVIQTPVAAAPELPKNPVAGPVQTATPAPPGDLWVRIRRGMAMRDLAGNRVSKKENWYASRPDYIQRMTERSGRYLFHIVEEIERRNMPMELALLPFIESAFNPEAVSSARAAGMWQFMPATGKSFDLQQNAFRDERRDVLASTEAALDYLQQLHDRFGDWHLALAAYNWGQGNVNRAITRNTRAGLPASYTDLKMPLETQDYVPKLQAVKNIVMRPEAFGVTLPEIDNHPFFNSVTIERDMDVSVIALLADVEEKEFRALNPAHNRPVVLAAATPQILLPWDNAAIFQTNLATYDGPLASWTTWAVPSTMTVTQAANQLRLDESILRSVNKIPPHMRILAGSNLLIPRTERHTKDVPEHVATSGRLEFQAEVRLRRITVLARTGETLAQLAKRHRADPQEAARLNKLAINAQLKKKQRVALMVPVKTTTAKAKPRSAKKKVQTARKKSKQTVASRKTP
jgi:membrane-bound lytic murein transglycosylase D